MALARKYSRRKTNPIKFSSIFKKKKYLFLAILLAAFALYGVINILRVLPSGKDKQEISFETGDRPLPQKIKLWVTNAGGLNMRKEPSVKSQLILLIPAGTELVAEELRDDWYRVLYMDKEGWVSKRFVSIVPPSEDPLKGWKTYQDKNVGYSVRIPSDWLFQDYGPNPATSSLSYVGFGMALPAEINSSNQIPILIRQSSLPYSQILAELNKMSGVTSEPTTISGLNGTKFVYNNSSGVQVTVFVVERGSGAIVIEESGGYSDELEKIKSSLIFL